MNQNSTTPGVASSILIFLLAMPGGALQAARPAAGAVPGLATTSAGDPLPEGAPSRSLTGEFVSYAQVKVYPRVAGPLTRINFREGDVFRKGDVLAVIDRREYEISRDEARANLEALEARLEAMTAGGRPEEIRRAQARLSAADAVLENARQSHERIASLHARGSVTRQQLDAAIRELEVAQADQLSAQKDLELVRAGPRPEEKKEARALVQQARARLDRAELDLEYTEVRAPFDGGIGRRLVDPGAYLLAASSPQATAICVFSNARTMKAILDIPERDLPFVRLGRTAYVQVQAAPDQWFPGTITNLYPFVDPQTRMGKVEVEVPNEDSRLLTGMFVKGVIEVSAEAATSAAEVVGTFKAPRTANPN